MRVAGAVGLGAEVNKTYEAKMGRQTILALTVPDNLSAAEIEWLWKHKVEPLKARLLADANDAAPTPTPEPKT